MKLSNAAAVSARSPYVLYLVALFLLVASSLPAWAQEATILGTVTDQSGAAIPDVSVTVTNTDTGQSSQFKTNNVGQYVAPSLKIGHYTVQASGASFANAEQKDIALGVGDRRRIDFQLKVGGTQQSVTVEANAVAVQSDTGEQSYLINSQQVTQLSTNGRAVCIGTGLFL